MCQAFSGIIKKNGDVLWKFGMDLHGELIKKHGLRDDTDDPLHRTFVRFEIAPANKNYLNPDQWVFKLDEKTPPSWFADRGGWYEKECWKAHKQWLTKLHRILIHKPSINPFSIKPPKKITKKHLALLKHWASVGASVRASVRASVGDSVGDSVWDSVWDSVGASVWDSVGDSVGDSVRASVRASVWDSVGDSVWDSVKDSVKDSVGAYIGSFFKLPRKAWKYTEKIKTTEYPFQPAVDLWMMGLVLSFDGKTWRLHGGPRAKVLYVLKPE